MNHFNGRFDVMDGGYYDGINYRIVGTIVDNSGTYFATDAQIGDILYLDGTMIGFPLLRYKIVEINYEETMGATLSAIVEWDTLEIDTQEPFGGMEGIIGALHSNGLTANITPIAYNSANELLIANANSYQSMLLGLNSGGGSPDLTDIKKDVEDLKTKMNSTHLEWEEMMRLEME